VGQKRTVGGAEEKKSWEEEGVTSGDLRERFLNLSRGE